MRGEMTLVQADFGTWKILKRAMAEEKIHILQNASISFFAGKHPRLGLQHDIALPAGFAQFMLGTNESPLDLLAPP